MSTSVAQQPSPQLFFQTINAHQRTEALKAAIELEVFTAIGEGNSTAAEIAKRARDGDRVAIAGLVICRQRPGTAKGFVFLTLEDETGMINVVVTPKLFEKQALLISTTPLLLIRGVLQIEETVVNVRADYFRALQAEVGAEFARSHDFH